MKDIRYVLYSGLVLLLIGCANRGIGPQGGPRDTIPPKLVKEEPLNRTTNFNAKKIEISFNEYIQGDKVAENVLISPPMRETPEIKFISKRVTVQLMDTLRPETTYTIDFGNAICDFTEKNPIKGYRYAFSTGEVIDSMSIEGKVINSEDLKPAIGVLVGAYASEADSAFETQPFDYVAKTDSSGYFRIDNMRPGRYSVYALQDISRDYFYQPGEGLAFGLRAESRFLKVESVECSVDSSLVVDSLVVDSLVVDSVVNDELNREQSSLNDEMMDSSLVENEKRELPVMYFFKEEKTRLYFQRALRNESYQMQFLFAGKRDSLPTFRALRPSEVDSSYNDSKYVDWMPYCRWSYNKTNDTITAWLTDSVAIMQDSIFVEIGHYRTDSVYELEYAVDTVKCIYRAPRLTEKLMEERRQQWENRKVKVESNAKGNFGLDQPVILTFAMPIDSIQKDSITLWRKQDSTYLPLEYQLQPLDDIGLKYEVVYAWKPEGAYEIRIDSAAVRDVYGKVNNKTVVQFKLRSVEEYATLLVYVNESDVPLRLQLLEKDKVVREESVKEGKAYFNHLEPKTYTIRIYKDRNNDGLWTTGDWLLKRQPEEVFNYEKELPLKANWDFEETIQMMNW